MFTPKVRGFLKEPKRTARDGIYRGRFICPDVQWTESGEQVFCTFTATAGQIGDAAASGLLWTDQDVQRGIQPGITPVPPRELSLTSGYPDPKSYIFDATNADLIVEKLLNGQTLFLSPLVWNLRPRMFEAYWSETDRDIYLYSGKIYLPDSHHRHQAIVKALSIWRDAQKEYPNFSDNVQFKIELYFLSQEDEGNYFFDKNQRPKPTSKSKAYDLTTQDDLSLLAKLVVEKSNCLASNVNRVTDRLDSKNPQVITLSTLREMMRTFAAVSKIDMTELEGLAAVAAEFYDLLASVRPELGRQNLLERKVIRKTLIVDSAVVMHGYAYLMRDFNTDMARFGPNSARETWRKRLQILSSSHICEYGKWSGDLFDKHNPLWNEIGLTRVGSNQSEPTVLNTGAARIQAGRVLRQLTSMQGFVRDITFLGKR